MAISKAAEVANFEQLYWEKARKSFKEGRLGKNDEKELDKFLQEKSTPREAKESCASLKKRAGEEYSPALGGILEKIEIAMAVGDLAIKSAPESVGLAWMGIRLCLHSLEDDFATISIFGAACSDIIGIMISCATFSRMYGPSRGIEEFKEIHAQVTDRIPKVYAEILDFSFSVKRYLSRNKGLRVIKGLFAQASAKYGGKVKSIKDHDAAMAEFAKRASMQLSDYYDRKGEQNQEAMMTELSDIRAKLQWSNQNNMVQMDLLKQLSEKLSSMRELTPHEIAMKNFEENLKKLNASSDQEAVLAAKLARRSPPETCTWIFNLDAFKSWYDEPMSAMLWVSGGGGFGKSILTSAMIDELQKRSTDTGGYVCYFFCNASDDATKAADRICKHILSQVYGSLRHQNTETIEKANILAAGYLKGASRKSGKDEKVDDVGFDEACRGLAALTSKTLFIVVDALDECTDNQKVLVSSLKGIITEAQSKIKLVVCSRPEPDIEAALESVSRIKVEDNNGPDIKINAQTELLKLRGWTAGERDLACEKIVKKAGPHFRYVEMAMQFLKKPWQRPLSRHLEQLPQGLEASYELAVRKTDPAYLELLVTCLTWAILADGRIRASEIIDAYSCIYTSQETELEASINEVDGVSDFNDFAPGEDLYIQQIRAAGSTLLEVDSTSQVVQVRHNTIKDFFLKSGAVNSQKMMEPAGPTCIHCSEVTPPRTAFNISEKSGHMSMAITTLRHLMSESFRQKYLVPFERKQLKGTYKNSALNKKAEEEAEPESTHSVSSEDNPKETGDEHGDTEMQINGTNQDGHVDDNKHENSPAKTLNNDGEDTAADNVIREAEQISNDEEKTDPESNDSEDEQSDSQTVIDSDFDMEDNMYFYDVPQEDDPAEIFRYEINKCEYHMTKVEELWKPEDRNGADWAEYENLRATFFCNDSRFFQSWVNLRNQERWSKTYWVDDVKTIQPLHIAAAHGLLSLVHTLLEGGADLNALTDEGYTALDFAIENYGRNWNDEQSRKNNFEVMKLLLEKGADCNKAASPEHDQPFIRVFWQAPKLEVVELFLDHGADVAMVEPWWKRQPLHICCRCSDDAEVARRLFKAGADPNFKDDSGETALHILMHRSEEISADFVQVMFDHGADVNAEDEMSQRPLYELCSSGNVEIAKMLIEKGADVMDDDSNKITALHMACKSGHTELVKLLLQKGAQISALDDRDRTPFYYACDAPSNDTAKMLIEILSGEDVAVFTLANKDGKTPLRKAAARGHTEIVAALFEKSGQDVNVLISRDTSSKDTPLHAAARHAHKEVVEFLLQKGVDLGLQNKKGQTPLEVCIEAWTEAKSEDFEAICLRLLEEDPRSPTGTNLLHTAAMRGSLKVLNKILDKGADPQAKDEHGWTAIELARHYNQEEVVTVLSERKTATALRPSQLRCPLTKVLCFSDDCREFSLIENKIFAPAWANHPVPSGLDGYYFEVEIEAPGRAEDDFPEVSIGLCSNPTRSVKMWLPGRYFPKVNAFSYHGDVGEAYAFPVPEKSRSNLLPKFGHGDIIGCGLDVNRKAVFFTKNGSLLEVRSSDLAGLPRSVYAHINVSGRLYPVVGTTESGVTMKINFGDAKTRPFKWELANGVVAAEWIKFVAEEEDLVARAPVKRHTTRFSIS